MGHKQFKMLLTLTTDWIVAIVAIGQLFITGVGFWLLYNTFVLQAKVAVDQQSILEIESRRSRREIRPVFKVTGIANDNIPGYVTFGFTCEFNDAYRFNMVNRSGKYISVRENEVNIATVNKGATLNYSYAIVSPDKYTVVDLQKNPDYKIELR